MAKLISSLVGEHGRPHKEAAVNVRFGSKTALLPTAQEVGPYPTADMKNAHRRLWNVAGAGCRTMPRTADVDWEAAGVRKVPNADINLETSSDL